MDSMKHQVILTYIDHASKRVKLLPLPCLSTASNEFCGLFGQNLYRKYGQRAGGRDFVWSAAQVIRIVNGPQTG